MTEQVWRGHIEQANAGVGNPVRWGKKVVLFMQVKMINGSDGNMHPSRLYVLRNHHASYEKKKKQADHGKGERGQSVVNRGPDRIIDELIICYCPGDSIGLNRANGCLNGWALIVLGSPWVHVTLLCPGCSLVWSQANLPLAAETECWSPSPIIWSMHMQ